ncbi:Phenylacetate-coenzyme A ligase PaaK, adenylate-forming domain family [Promicromonospora umidemergens]|uniref:Coenzyme F390 synthetase n=1 Tax=Promicromonospora umidemergens TaxID=629679 RepID=A0ABP8Y185_9MICO|nr:phenylacetate--CoA ligase family protein [Promicromonospora umidemergens]MCP2286876.1 Phenylacetate-coenzyme A ligase PaaK, adenylate-forming domain family [Promicromonospora umidemergens]
MTTESRLSLLRDARATRRQGKDAIARRQRDRLADLVAFARARSPYYREHYRHLPERGTDPTLLPVTSKAELMPRFDDWVTDPSVTLAAVRAFVEDPALIGEKFLGRYTVSTTSGTTGTPGIFLTDQRVLAVTSAVGARTLSSWLTATDVAHIVARGGRTAMVIATGGHFASTAAAAALRRNRLRRNRIGVFGVHTPMPELVEALNAFRPTLLAPYASMGALLATEQQAGRLHIDPALVVLSAEGLPAPEYDRIATAFGAKVRHSYAANECPFLSQSCAHGWLHLNSDWAILEPVDADHQPVPPGQRSHTALLTNLANRTQPIVRYDLGDAVLVRPDPCPCGDPLPAIQVQGRAADLLTFPARSGQPVTIAPLSVSLTLERLPGVERFQIVQTAPANLSIRLQPTSGADTEQVWQTVHTELTRLLTSHGLDDVTVTRADEPPQQTSGGKYREVIPLT